MQSQQNGQVCCATYKAGEIEIKATLLVKEQGAQQQFSIVLEHEGERAFCEIGTQALLAKKVFFDVVFGGVTACTLSDVVEDILADACLQA